MIVIFLHCCTERLKYILAQELLFYEVARSRKEKFPIRFSLKFLATLVRILRLYKPITMLGESLKRPFPFAKFDTSFGQNKVNDVRGRKKINLSQHKIAWILCRCTPETLCTSNQYYLTLFASCRLGRSVKQRHGCCWKQQSIHLAMNISIHKNCFIDFIGVTPTKDKQVLLLLTLYKMTYNPVGSF